MSISAMKKATISVFVVVAFAIYSIHARSEQSSTTVRTPISLQNNSSSSSSTTSPSSNVASTATMASSTSTRSNSTHKDGTYTGNTADAYYGNIQVRVTISSGKLAHVEFLQYPNDHQESVQINSQAMPYLKQEAIQAQSAQVDGVSGATDTSQAFIQSLSSALNQARAQAKP